MDCAFCSAGGISDCFLAASGSNTLGRDSTCGRFNRRVCRLEMEQPYPYCVCADGPQFGFDYVAVLLQTRVVLTQSVGARSMARLLYLQTGRCVVCLRANCCRCP